MEMQFTEPILKYWLRQRELPELNYVTLWGDVCDRNHKLEEKEMDVWGERIITDGWMERECIEREREMSEHEMKQR